MRTLLLAVVLVVFVAGASAQLSACARCRDHETVLPSSQPAGFIDCETWLTAGVPDATCPGDYEPAKEDTRGLPDMSTLMGPAWRDGVLKNFESIFPVMVIVNGAIVIPLFLMGLVYLIMSTA